MKKQLLSLFPGKTLISFFLLLISVSKVDATIHNVTVQDFQFSPANLTGVIVGDTVRWTWLNGVHTTTSTVVPGGAATWDSPITSTNNTFDYKVTVAGSYTYVCTFHAPSMSGTFTATAPLSSDKDITSFSFTSPAATGTINQTNNTISVTVPFGTNVTALVPSITHTGATINPASGVAQDFTNPVNYTVTAQDASTQTYTVTVNVTPASSTKDITSFNFTNPAATGVIDQANNTIQLTVPFGTNVTALVPSITHTGATINPASGVAQNFTNPVNYTVTAQDASTQTYTVTVNVTPASSTKDITSFNFTNPAATGTIDQANNTIQVTVPAGTNVTALVPTITHTGTNINPASGVAQNFTNPVNYTVTAADASMQTYTVTVTVAPSSSKDITAFNFTNPAATGVINQTNKTIQLTVPSGTNVTNLTPSITHTGASVSPNSGVPQDFTSPRTYTVTAADASTRTYTVTVSVSTSIKEYALMPFAVYPNPFYQTLNIELKNSTFYYAIITDVVGKEVFRMTLENQLTKLDANTNLELQKMPNGVYFLTLTSSKEAKTIRIVKSDK